MIKILEKDIYNKEINGIWNNILLRSQTYDLSQEYVYTLIWWKFYKNEVVNKELLLYFENNEDDNSIWPLMHRKQFLLTGVYAIGQIDGFITDYAIPIIENQHLAAKNIIKVINKLNEDKIKWNFFKLNIPAWAGYIDMRMEEELSDILFITKEFDKYTCIELNNTFDDYLTSVGSKTRSDIRKYIRIFQKENFQFEIVENRDQIKKALPKLISLNKSNWSIFTKSKNIAFFYELIEECDKLVNGNIFIASLKYDNNTVATVFGYISNKKCFLHTAGVSRTKIMSLSPGITLYALLINELCHRNIKLLDLSPGIEEYKIRLNAKIETITQIVIFKNNYSKFIYIIGQNLIKFIKK